MSQLYPNLFKPGRIGPFEIKNRIVQGPVDLEASSYNGEFSDEYIKFYEQTARSGAGLIITAYASVDDEYSQSFAGCQLKLTDRRQSGQLSKLARAVHKYDAKIMIQTYMAGRSAVPTAVSGKRIIAPSAVGFTKHDQIPEEMNLEQIKSVPVKFAKAAEMIRDAGLDGIEIVAAGGYIINQFLSPKSNLRTDEYGGSFENRTRIVKEIHDAIREKVGHDIIVSIRFSADEFLDGGYGLEDGVEFAKFFEQVGFDCININNANQEKRYYIIEPIGMQTGWKSYIIRAIKDAVSIPVLSTNVIKKPEDAEKFLAEGLMDYAVMARAFMADPDWAKKARKGLSDEIRPCIGCLHCLEQQCLFRTATCAVNPLLNRWHEFGDVKQDLTGKKIIVAGAGPAGMEAAMLLKKRGADVKVYEAKGHAGGAARLGGKLLGKKPLEMLAQYYDVAAEKEGIPVVYNTPVTKELVASEAPFAVFVACGADPRTIEGFEPDGEKIFTAEEVIDRDLTFPGKKVAVLGGGMTALETAEMLAQEGSEVSVIIRSDKLGKGVDPDNVVTPLEHLNEYGAKIYKLTTPLRFTEDGVKVKGTKTGLEDVIEADIVVTSLGELPRNQLVSELSGICDRVIPIGDSKKPGRVANAVHSAYEQAYIFDPED